MSIKLNEDAYRPTASQDRFPGHDPTPPMAPWRHIAILMVTGSAVFLLIGVLAAADRASDAVASTAINSQGSVSTLPPESTEESVQADSTTTPSPSSETTAPTSTTNDTASVEPSTFAGPVPMPGNPSSTSTDPATSAPVSTTASPPPSSDAVGEANCGLESSIRSIGAATPISIRFVNRTDGDVELFWLDYDGERQSHGVLESGGTVGKDTFRTHPWLVIDEMTGECIHLEPDPIDGAEVVVGKP